MFNCTECGRFYSSQNTLNRHKHNHGKVKQHVCSICQVVFARADLCSRHMKLHKNPALAESLSSAGAKTKDCRKRCHTACTRCRELRTKCSGQQPCATCSIAGKACSYQRDSLRISRVRVSPESTDGSLEKRINELSPERNLDGEENTACADPTSYPEQPLPGQQSHDEVEMTIDSLNVEGGLVDGSDTQAFAMSYENTHASLLQHDQLYTFPFAHHNQPNQFETDISWPWMHENLFMQNDAMLSWYPLDPSVISTGLSDSVMQGLIESNAFSSPPERQSSNQLGQPEAQLDHEYLNNAEIRKARTIPPPSSEMPRREIAVEPLGKKDPTNSIVSPSY